MLYVARPGLIIGKKGQEVEVLQEELQNLIGRRVNLKVEEVHRPEIYGQLVAEDIAQQLQKRGSFRRSLKRAIDTSMDAGAKGIKIQLSVDSACRNGSMRERNCRCSTIEHAAGQNQLRFCRSRYAARQYRYSGMD